MKKLSTHIRMEVAELIDTLWNVNDVNTVKWCKATGELIDTLWNVNLMAMVWIRHSV